MNGYWQAYSIIIVLDIWQCFKHLAMFGAEVDLTAVATKIVSVIQNCGTYSHLMGPDVEHPECRTLCCTAAYVAVPPTPPM